jgi:putative transposase
MVEHEQEYPVLQMCQILEVPKSSYYYLRNKDKSNREICNSFIEEEIKEIFEESRKTYGIKRIQVELSSRGINIGHNKIAKIKQKNGIYPKMRRRYKQTTESKHSNRVEANILDREFKADKPNDKWVSDITYISTLEGWLYLSSVIDLYSRKVIGWSMSDTIDSKLVCDSLEMALSKRKDVYGCIFHSDRGSQYTSESVRNKLLESNIIQSMSRKGNCWDNAVAESFFKTLKYDGDLIKVFKTKDEAKLCIFEFIEVFYNRKRRHSSISYFTPHDFELQYYQQIS